MKINVIEYLEETAMRFSNKIAVEDINGAISFNQLEERSQQIAVEILKYLPISNQPIAVFLPNSKEAIISFLGIEYSGNFYIPLDIKSPIERVKKILDKLETKIIISDNKGSEILKKSGYTENLLLIEDVFVAKYSNESSVQLKKILKNKIDLDPVYSIFTSGSTGTPKGVIISHRGVIDYIEWAKETYDVTDKEIIGSQAPFYFDNSTLDIYLMIATGAKLIIVPEEKYMFPVKLLEYVEEKEINFVFWVPSVLISIANFDVLSNIKPKSLKKILFAGEVMPNKHLNYWRGKLPNVLYSNLYGPTEITVDCTFYTIDRTFNDDDPLPIGKPCRNTNVIVLNEENELVKQGEKGELCVRGSSLAFGYFADEEKTKEAFVQNPLNLNYPDIIYRTGDLVYYNENEELIFVGRKDSQIKHLGYRIELGEIENIILGINKVKNACVLYDNDKKEIICYYIGTIESLDIRRKIVTSLPKYMVPTKWKQLEVFPLNKNGKIDRKTLGGISI